MDSTATASLILGSSNSGKTYLAKSIANSSSYDVNVINGYEDDFPPNVFSHITFEEFESDIESFYNSILIYDDVVKPTEFQLKVLSEILVKHKRHGNINVMVLAHSIERNGLNSIIKHFDKIIFTNSQKNTPVFKVYNRKFCSLDDEKGMRTWTEFITKESKTNYLVYNHKTSDFEIIDSRGNVVKKKEDQLRKEILRYITPFGECEMAMSFFDYLYRILPANSVTQDDHILNLVNHKSGEKLEVNILDLVYYVPRRDLPIPPKNNIVTAFQCLQKLYKIPYCFIGNKHFL